MSDPLTPKQKDAIWALLAQGGQGKAPAKATRDPLVSAKLIRPGYSGAVALVEVTDAGWAWADRHLGDDDAASAKALQPWLKQIKAYLDAKNLMLADLFPTVPEPLSPGRVKLAAKPRPAAKPKAPKATATLKPTKAPTETQLRTRIKQAYLLATGGRKATRALLSDVRGQMHDVDRATLDAALTRWHLEGKTMTLMRLDNPIEITPAARDAQIVFKGEPLHLLWMSR